PHNPRLKSGLHPCLYENCPLLVLLHGIAYGRKIVVCCTLAPCQVTACSLLCSCFYARRCAMGTRWLLAVAAGWGLSWAGMVYGACNQELLHKLLDRGFSNEEILQMCGHPVDVPPTPSRLPERPPADARESPESKTAVPNTPSRPPDKPS